MIGCCVAVPRSHWLAVPTPLFIYISQLFRDSFSVSQQLTIWKPPSHYSMSGMQHNATIWSAFSFKQHNNLARYFTSSSQSHYLKGTLKGSHWFKCYYYIQNLMRQKRASLLPMLYKMWQQKLLKLPSWLQHFHHETIEWNSFDLLYASRDYSDCSLATTFKSLLIAHSRAKDT